LVSGNTTTSGGPPITMGGNEIPIPTFTSAIAVTGETLTSVKRIAPKSNFFILLPPSLASPLQRYQCAYYIDYSCKNYLCIFLWRPERADESAHPSDPVTWH
jgi:hypothetical protein